MFWSLYKSIFQNLISGDEENFHLNTQTVSLDGSTGGITITWSDSIHLVDSQFTNYVKKTTWDSFKADIESEISALELRIDTRIGDFKKRAKLNYGGAVELQSRKTKIDAEDKYHIYDDFKYGVG